MRSKRGGFIDKESHYRVTFTPSRYDRAHDTITLSDAHPKTWSGKKKPKVKIERSVIEQLWLYLNSEEDTHATN